MRNKHIIHGEFLSWLKRGSHEIIIPNYFYKYFEADVFRVTAQGYIVEYEIKISKADFKADFLKSSFTRSNEREFKHDHIKAGRRCNKFFYVAPAGLIIKEEIPKYAGLIVLDINSIYTLKPAPFISKDPFALNEYKNIAIKLSARESFLRSKLNRLTRGSK